MKKILTFLVLTILLTSFAFASPFTSHAIENDENSQGNNVETQSEQSTANQGESTQIQTRSRTLTEAQIGEITQYQKRLQIKDGECSEGCTCSGATMKCPLESGGRELTITAGNSGKIIIKTQDVDVSTEAELYQSNGKVYGEFNGVLTEINAMPDMVKEKVIEELSTTNLTEEEITLEEDGTYNYQAREKVRLFGFIQARVRVTAELNSETGELERVRKSWWAFLTKQDNGEILIGASCGTVTPGYNDACCENKGYDYWDETNSECLFSIEETTA